MAIQGRELMAPAFSVQRPCTRHCYPVARVGMRHCLMRAPATVRGWRYTCQAVHSQNAWGKRLLDVVDVGAALGSLGGVVAVLVTGEVLLLSLPVALVAVAHLIGMQKQFSSKQADRAALQEVQEAGEALPAVTAAAVRVDLQILLQQLRKELAEQRGDYLPLDEINRAILPLQQDLREVFRASNPPEQWLTRQDSQLQALERRIESKLRTHEGSLKGLLKEMMSMLGAAESSMQVVVRAEVQRALEPLRALPDALAAALRVTDVTPLQAAGSLQLPGPQLAELTATERERLREALSQDLRQALQSFAETQRTQSEGAPMQLASQQWTALGARLGSIEDAIKAVDAAQAEAGAGSQGGSEEIAEQLALLKEQQASQLRSLGDTITTSLSEAAGALGDIRQQLGDMSREIRAAGAEDASSGSEISAELLEQLSRRVQESPGESRRALQTSQETLDAQAERSATGLVCLQSLQVQLESQLEAVAQKLHGLTEAIAGCEEEIMARQPGLQQGDIAVVAEQVGALQAVQQDMQHKLGAVLQRLEHDATARTIPDVSGMAVVNDREPGPANLAAKGYKGGLQDSKEVAYMRMQDLLSSQSGDASKAEALPTATDPSGSSTSQQTHQEIASHRVADVEELGSSSPPTSQSLGASLDSQREQERLLSSDGREQSLETSTLDPLIADGVHRNGVGRSWSEQQLPENAQGALRSMQWADNERGPDVMESATQREMLADANDAVDDVHSLVLEGRWYLNEGRERTREGGFSHEAEEFLLHALACFEDAASLQPSNVTVLGNLGNSLMALGLLKRALIDDVSRASPTSAMQVEDVTAEAEDLLIRAGQHFRAILQQDAQDLKALVNWGKALCVRAGLAATKQGKRALYEGAVSKLEAVLAVQPDNMGALRTCSLALKGLAEVATSIEDRRQLLEDAARHEDTLLELASSESGSVGS